MSYTVHTIESAPEAARETLEGAQKVYGRVPNLLGIMAEAPPLAKAYATLAGLFDKTSLSPVERQVVLLSASVENGCTYCVAAHTARLKMAKVADEDIAALRSGRPVSDPKLEALHLFTTAMVTSRGWVLEGDIEAFLKAGYTKANVLEVILGVGMKTLSNYTNHLADTPLDEPMQPFAWQAPKREAAE